MSNINAVSASLADVLVAVSNAVDGDVVYIPAGVVTWMNTLTIEDKAVTLVGAGELATVIINGQAAGDGNTTSCVIKVDNSGNTFWRITGLGFIGVDGQRPTIGLVGPIYQFRVDNCTFNKGDIAIGPNLAYSGFRGSGPVYGVVDHCTFINMGRPIYASDYRLGDVGGGSQAWAEAILPGTQYMLYVEDSDFIWNSNMTAENAQGAVYGYTGGKLCFRHNTCTGFAQYIDAHGDEDGGGDYGTIFYEIYSNTFDIKVAPYGCFGPASSNSSDCITNQRGGKRICYNNVYTSNRNAANIATTEYVHKLMVYNESDAAARRVKDTHYWNETYNLVTDLTKIVKVSLRAWELGVPHLTLNTDWWNAAPIAAQTFYPYTAYTYPHPLTVSAASALASFLGTWTIKARNSADVVVDTHSASLCLRPKLKTFTIDGVTSKACVCGANATFQVECYNCDFVRIYDQGGYLVATLPIPASGIATLTMAINKSDTFTAYPVENGCGAPCNSLSVSVTVPLTPCIDVPDCVKLVLPEGFDYSGCNNLEASTDSPFDLTLVKGTVEKLGWSCYWTTAAKSMDGYALYSGLPIICGYANSEDWQVYALEFFMKVGGFYQLLWLGVKTSGCSSYGRYVRSTALATCSVKPDYIDVIPCT